MSEIKVDKQQALKAYGSASAATKKVLEGLFGKENLKHSITERIKTFEDACKELKLDPKTAISKTDTLDEVAYKKLKIIARALNQGWKPDYTNGNQGKYYPWFEYKKGSGFSFFFVFCNDTDSRVGSRLCFETEQLAEYAGKQFQSIYNDFLKP